MQRQSIIVLIKKSFNETKSEEITEVEVTEQVEAWGSLKEACQKHGWSYNTVSRKKLPVQYKDWLIHRCPFRALYSQEGREK